MSVEARSSPFVGWVIAGLTAAVFAAVLVALFASPARVNAGDSPSTLATLNAALNLAAAVLLVVGYAFIRRKNVRAHRACMVAAFLISCVFLVTYLLHHARVGAVPYRGVGAIRALYFAVLIPHIVLAAAVVPLALLTLYRGWTRRIEKHRRIARWTLPIWLYVSVSGAAVYVMLYHG